jgi:hypothetical protein
MPPQPRGRQQQRQRISRGDKKHRTSPRSSHAAQQHCEHRRHRERKQHAIRLDDRGHPQQRTTPNQSDGCPIHDSLIVMDGVACAPTPPEQQRARRQQHCRHHQVALPGVGRAVAEVNQREHRARKHSGQPVRRQRDNHHGAPNDGHQRKVGEPPRQGPGPQQVDRGPLQRVSSGHVHVKDVAIGQPAVVHQEADIVQQRRVAHDRPVESPRDGPRHRSQQRGQHQHPQPYPPPAGWAFRGD